jgi:conjugative transfer signal peptidase TraF
VLLLQCVLAVAIALFAGVRYVGTPSVPPGIWWVHHGTITRDGYVMACLPASIAAFGRERGYLDAGICAGHISPVMKRVIALPGDMVVLDASGLTVNGAHIANSARLARDSHQRLIFTFAPSYRGRVPAHTYWLLGDWFRSWDSRYYGPVDASAVLGVGTPLIVGAAGG